MVLFRFGRAKEKEKKEKSGKGKEGVKERKGNEKGRKGVQSVVVEDEEAFMDELERELWGGDSSPEPIAISSKEVEDDGGHPTVVAAVSASIENLDDVHSSLSRVDLLNDGAVLRQGDDDDQQQQEPEQQEQQRL